MSEVRELRPRLDSRELRFLIHVLEAYDSMLTLKTGELKTVKEEIRRLNGEFGRLQTYDVLKQLKAKRTELSNMKAQHFSEQAIICRGLHKTLSTAAQRKEASPKMVRKPLPQRAGTVEILEPKSPQISELSNAS